jgi:hypothetical protein
MKASGPLRELLAGVIDYAGLFPPAGLDMTTAVRNYASYLAGEYSWMLGRFIVSSVRLEEFGKAASRYLSDKKWKIGILGKPGTWLDESGFEVDAIELTAERIKDIQPFAGADTYFEVPVTAPPLERMIEAIGRTEAKAKIRTGGLTAAAFPEPAGVAHFQWLCHRAGVAFKATAGLHHPLRGVHPFTCDPESQRGIMHGFLNVFLAAVLIFTGASEQDATRLLEERSPDAFGFDEDSVHWRSFQFTRQQIQNARKSFAISFGSCSFEDPVRELGALGLI